MVRTPRAYLMDEPLTNLDFQLRVEMRGELKRLQRELRGTFFYVTNDQIEAMSLADRIAVLNKGVLQQVDTPEIVYQQPKNLFVATFIGNPRMNFINAAYDREIRQLVVRTENWIIPITDAQRALLDRSGETDIIVGIRAEDITLTRPVGEARASEVYVIEPLGDRLLVDVNVGKAHLRVKMPPTFVTEPGEPLGVTLQSEGLHFFSPKTENRIG
jgi:multiple sugar transport system ATP-binding protein